MYMAHYWCLLLIWMLRTTFSTCVLISVATYYLERGENAMTFPIMAHSIFALLFVLYLAT